MNDYDNYLEVIDEIKKIDITKTPRYRMCCYNFFLDFSRQFVVILQILRNLSNVNGRKQRRISY